ncbi:helix-turn-helix domain-containing protein [uncultured Piscinibacter sp.]|uniref:excisionase family DNA-binding protein n=1 Tax=uncultured Piscinibacter sp. TaxID=1131835 RepID=UPI00260AFF6E|nr:helix-turn-helix domain-containing protein [uncultured Piscinibacter sp.]
MTAATCKTIGRGMTMADLMTVAEAAQALGVIPRRVRAMIAAGQLRAERSGPRLWLIERATVEALAATEGRSRGGRPRKATRAEAPAVEIVLDRDAVERAAAGAMRGLPLVDSASGSIVSPQLVAFTAGLAAAKARRGIYRASEGADISVDGGVYRVRLYAEVGRQQPTIDF